MNTGDIFLIIFFVCLAFLLGLALLIKHKPNFWYEICRRVASDDLKNGNVEDARKFLTAAAFFGLIKSEQLYKIIEELNIQG